VGEFGIGIGVGDVAAGRHIQAMHFDAGDVGDQMAAIEPVAPGWRADVVERQLGQDGDAVIALHAVIGEVGIAQGAAAIGGKQLVGDLGLLQADNVGIERGDDLGQQRQPQPQRIDVPGNQAHGDPCGLKVPG